MAFYTHLRLKRHHLVSAAHFLGPTRKSTLCLKAGLTALPALLYFFPRLWRWWWPNLEATKGNKNTSSAKYAILALGRQKDLVQGLHSKTLSQATSNRKWKGRWEEESQFVTQIGGHLSKDPVCSTYTIAWELRSILYPEFWTPTNLMLFLLTLQCSIKRNHGKKKTVCKCDSNSKHTVCSVF